MLPATARHSKVGKCCRRPLEREIAFCLGKYSGTEVKLDGTEHVILIEDDVLTVIG